MNKNYLKTLLLFPVIEITVTLLITMFNYIELFNYKTASIISLIFTILLFIFLGYRISSLEKKQGYKCGFIISIIIIMMFLITSLIISKVNLYSLIYYLILILSSMIGGIIGVTKK